MVMVAVTQLVRSLAIDVTSRDVKRSNTRPLHLIDHDDDGNYVGDVNGVYVMMLVGVSFTNPKVDVVCCDIRDDQIEVHDLLQDAWCKCRNECMQRPTWCLDTNVVQQCVKRIRRFIMSFGDIKKIEFEVPVCCGNMHGVVDCIALYDNDDVVIFEVKCVKTLKDEHKQQLHLYLQLLKKVKPHLKNPRGILYNAFNNHGIEIFQ